MSNESVISRLLAVVRAVLPEDWLGRAGERFSKTAEAISDFAEEHNVRPRELADEGVDLVRTTLHGKAHKDLAAAAKDYADAENARIEAELKRRSLESKVQKEEADAALARLQVVHAEADLLAKLQRLKVILRKDEHGNLTVLPVPSQFKLEVLANRQLGNVLVEVERVILGAIILDNAGFQQSAPYMGVKDLSTVAHKVIYSAMWNLIRRNLAIDFVNLVDELKRVDALQQAGGVGYVTSLTDHVPRIRTLKGYIELMLTLRERLQKT